MDLTPITMEESHKLGLTNLTYFRPRMATDDFISPAKQVEIGLEGKTVIVDCDIKKTKRQYNHFTWITKEAKRIGVDPDRIVAIVKNNRGGRALATN